MSEPEKSDLEAIRRYAELAGLARHNNPDNPAKLKRSALLGRSQAAAFSIPRKVVNEVERQADKEGVNLSQFVFNALVEKILTEKIREKYHVGPDTKSD